MFWKLIRFRHNLWPESQVVDRQSEQTSDDGEVAQPFQGMLPKLDAPRNRGILWQTAVNFRIGGVVENIDDVRTADACGIVDACIAEAGNIAELLRALFCEVFHVRFGAEVEAAGGTTLDACGLETLADPVGAERALENFARFGAEFRNVEWATRHAIAAADAVVFLKVDDAVGILNDGGVRGAGFQTAGIFAMHALILAH